jgi:hypothetical protein
MTDEDFPRRIPFAFLEDIKTRWKQAYGMQGKTAVAYQMNEDFKKVLQRQAVRTNLFIYFFVCCFFLALIRVSVSACL